MNWQHERSMTPRQYVHVIEQLGMSQAAAGRFLGITGRTSRRYASGDSMIPAGYVLLLNAMLHHGDRPVVPKWNRRQF